MLSVLLVWGHFGPEIRIPVGKSCRIEGPGLQKTQFSFRYKSSLNLSSFIYNVRYNYITSVIYFENFRFISGIYNGFIEHFWGKYIEFMKVFVGTVMKYVFEIVFDVSGTSENVLSTEKSILGAPQAPK